MIIDLDERFPHDEVCVATPDAVDIGRCDCTRDARIAAHIERLEGALHNVRMLAVTKLQRTDPENSAHLIRFCESAGIVGSVLRDT